MLKCCVFLFYLNLFFRVNENTFPKIWSIAELRPVARPLYSPMNHQLLGSIKGHVFFYQYFFFKVIMKNIFPGLEPSTYLLRDNRLHHKTFSCRDYRLCFSNLPKSLLKGHNENTWSIHWSFDLIVKRPLWSPLEHPAALEN